MEKIGFIGQGYVGRNYADAIEAKGFEIVRYALEPEYVSNKGALQDCRVVFVAVPTPTTPDGFDAHIVEESLKLLSPDTIAVIKSTVLPGMTAQFQKEFPELVLVFSPEFLREATASEDAMHPYSSIIGLGGTSQKHTDAAVLLRRVLPDAPFDLVCTSTEAELIKYIQNASGYIDIIAFNVFYDAAQKLGAEWEPILAAMRADPNIPSRFANPVHKNGRGAGGHCLIKDFAAFRELFQKLSGDQRSLAFLEAAEQKNLQLLIDSKKDLDLLRGVYGDTNS